MYFPFNMMLVEKPETNLDLTPPTPAVVDETLNPPISVTPPNDPLTPKIPTIIPQQWFLLDANRQVLGRLATRTATILMGKNLASYRPNLLPYQHVIITNASLVTLTGNKINTKVYYHHTRYPGGLKIIPAAKMFAKSPTKVVEMAIRGMLPKNIRGRELFRYLHVYPTSTHPHTGQTPVTLNFPSH